MNRVYIRFAHMRSARHCYEDGYEEGALVGTLKAVQRMMKNMGVSLEKAMDTLEIAGKDRDTIAKAING